MLIRYTAVGCQVRGNKRERSEKREKRERGEKRIESREIK
jgi:hypothetical protein